MSWLSDVLGFVFALVPIVFGMWILYMIVATYANSKSNGEKLDKIIELLEKDDNRLE